MPDHGGLPADALVIRLGPAGRWAEKALQQARDERDDPFVARALLSVRCVVQREGESVKEAVARACDASRLGYRWIRVGRAQDIGFDFVPDPGDPGHFNVDIVEASPERVDEFLSAFGPEEENPTWPKHRKR